MVDRRRFIQTLLVAAAMPATDASLAAGVGSARFGKLVRDPQQILDLPEGFEYQIVCRKGEQMDDGLLVPGKADDMAAFPGENGRVILVCNHENSPHTLHNGPFGTRLERLERIDKNKIYDFGDGRTPGSGGTTQSQIVTIAVDVLQIDPARFQPLSGLHSLLAGPVARIERPLAGDAKCL